MSIKLRRIGKAKAKPLVPREATVSAKVAFHPRSATTIFRELENLSLLRVGSPAGPVMNQVLAIVASDMAALEQRLKETLDSLRVFTAQAPVSQQAARHEYATQLEALVEKSVITPLEAAKLLRERGEPPASVPRPAVGVFGCLACGHEAHLHGHHCRATVSEDSIGTNACGCPAYVKS